MARAIISLMAALMAIVIAAKSSFAADFYVSPAQVDLIRILASPPAPDSAKGKKDLAGVLEAQRHRTPAEVASVKADITLSVFRFADTMGPGFKPENLPFASQFFARTAGGDDSHRLRLSNPCSPR